MEKFLPLLQTLVGGLLALAGAVIGNYLTTKQQQKRESRNLASAFYGEISSLLAIVERRQYVQYINDALEIVRKTGTVNFVSVAVTKNYFRVYEQNVGKIGLLPAPLPEKIVLFYTLGSAILEDFALTRDPDLSKYPPDAIEHYLSQLLTLLNEGTATGKEVLSLLRVVTNEASSVSLIGATHQS